MNGIQRNLTQSRKGAKNGGYRVTAHGNGGRLKGSDSIAWGNAPGHQVGRPNPQIKP